MEAALAALAAFIRKTHTSAVRWHGAAGLNARLLALARAWCGRAAGVSLGEATRDGDPAVTPAAVDAMTTLRFEFYSHEGDTGRGSGGGGGGGVGGGSNTPPPPATPSAGAAPSAPGLRVITAPPGLVLAGDEAGTVAALASGAPAAVPPRERFRLLAAVRAARAGASLAGRRRNAVQRLLAFYLLFQSAPALEDVAAFFAEEPELVADLVAALGDEAGVPVGVRTAALRALAVQLLDRARHGDVIAALTAGGAAGPLATLLRRGVAELTGSAGGGGGGGASSPPSPPRYTPACVEALLSLCGALVGSAAGCAALGDAGLVPSLLPLLRDARPAHTPLVAAGVRVLEAFLDFSPAAAGLFRDLGGLADMARRLRAEVEPGAPPAAAAAAAAATAAAAAAAGGSGGADDPATTTPALITIDAGAPPAGRPSYARRSLTKALLRCVALAAYTPGTGDAGRDGAEAAELHACLAAIFRRAGDFGGALFALAASVMADLIHHDPLCFPALEAAAVPEAFVDAVKAGVPPAGEALCCLPPALGALCLNSSGLARVRDAGALESVATVLTGPAYLRALQGDTPSVVGAGLDELMRHVPALRPDGVRAMGDALRKLCCLGGLPPDDPALAPHPPPPPPRAPRPGAARQQRPAAAAMEVDGGGGEAVAAAEGVGTAPAEPADPDPAPAPPPTRQPGDPWPGPARPPIAPDPEAGAWLADAVTATGRALEAALANGETARAFAAAGGAPLLLAPYRAPLLPPTFGSGGGAHALLAALRALAAAAAPPGGGSAAAGAEVAGPLGEALGAALAAATAAAAALPSPDVCVPDLPTDVRDAYVRALSRAEGLSAAAAAVARGSQPTLLAAAAGPLPAITALAALERTVAWQAAGVEDWRAAADAARAAERAAAHGRGEAAGGGGAGPPQATAGAPPPAPDVPAAMQEDGGLPATAAAAPPPPPAETEAAVPAAPAPPPVVGLPARGRKKAGDELAAEVVSHFAATARSFHAALAKAAAAAARRREGPGGVAPGKAARAACVALAAAMRDALAAAADCPPAGTALPPRVAALRASRVRTRAFEEVLATLVDARRRAVHCQVANYWAGCGGPAALVRAVGVAAAALDAAAADGGPEEEEVTPPAPVAPPASSTSVPTTKPTPVTVPPPRKAAVLEAAAASLGAALALLDALANAPLLRGSAGATSLLALPLPSVDGSSSSPPRTGEAVEADLRTAVLAAAGPLWSAAEGGRGLAAHAPRLVPRLAAVLERAVDGDASALATAVRRGLTEYEGALLSVRRGGGRGGEAGGGGGAAPAAPPPPCRTPRPPAPTRPPSSASWKWASRPTGRRPPCAARAAWWSWPWSGCSSTRRRRRPRRGKVGRKKAVRQRLTRRRRPMRPLRKRRPRRRWRLLLLPPFQSCRLPRRSRPPRPSTRRRPPWSPSSAGTAPGPCPPRRSRPRPYQGQPPWRTPPWTSPGRCPTPCTPWPTYCGRPLSAITTSRPRRRRWRPRSRAGGRSALMTATTRRRPTARRSRAWRRQWPRRPRTRGKEEEEALPPRSTRPPRPPPPERRAWSRWRTRRWPGSCPQRSPA